MDNISNKPINSDEISLGELIQKIKAFIQYLKTKWLHFVVAGFTGGLLGLGYYYLQSPKYTANCTFILEEKSGGGGGLAGLASQFGFDIGGGVGGSLFAGDNILEIIPSKNIVQTVLLTKVDSTTHQTLADLYIRFNRLDKEWAKNDRLKDIHFSEVPNIEQMTLIQDSILNVIYKAVIKSNLNVDWARKKASLIKVTVTSKNEQFSKYLTERVVEEARKLYIDIKTGTTQANVNKLQQKADSLYALLNNKSYQSAETQILNVNPAIKQALVPVEITTRDKTVTGTIYAEVVKQLITSKVLLSQQTPVIQVLDKPVFPLEDEKEHKLKLLVMGGLLALLFAILFYFGKFFFAPKISQI